MSKSEFARRQLKKHGWKEGSGLGKDEDGRADPIKVSLKMDKTGVGHDPGKEFTDHWWLRVFNEAAQKIGKKGKKNDSELPKSEEEEACSKMEQRRKNFYKGFVQSATLTNGVEEKIVSSESSEEDEKDTTNTVSVPTLEDIHKFCGGATGHRAASFGIRMEGKIKRASHHEKQFEENSKKNGLNNETGIKKRKQKKKKKEKEDKDLEALNSCSSELVKCKKSQKRKLVDETVDKEAIHFEDVPSKKSKKKKKDKGEKNILNNEIGGAISFSEVLSKEVSINDQKNGSVDTPKEKKDYVENSHETGSKSCKKKKKKKKNHD